MRHYDGTDAEAAASEDSAKGERFMEEAGAWIDANPAGWRYIVDQALLSASLHRRFGMKALCEHVRWHMTVNRGDADFKLNNNHTAAFTRILCDEHPEVEPYVKKRHSVMDV